MERINFKINGRSFSEGLDKIQLLKTYSPNVLYLVGLEVSSSVTLLKFIRDTAQLRGTKYMCLEAGCGACIVSVVKTPEDKPAAINSCMVSILSCHNWEITTIEKVGNRLDGYHPVQVALAEHNGTQCGHCSPGWVMAMYSLLKSKKDLTMLEIEKSFGSNICRCTGYRPILEAFKTFAKDAPNCQQIADIEDVHVCKKSEKNCEVSCNDADWCIISKKDLEKKSFKEIILEDGKIWYKVENIKQVFEILRSKGNDTYMLVAGNTAKGVYPIDDYPKILIDISGLSELKECYLDQNLYIGSGTTLTQLLDIFEVKAEQEYFEYLKVFYDHLKMVAHIAVRNLGTIGGNLMIKHQHNEFPSDIFLLLETVGAQITILFDVNVKQVLSMQQFLKLSMKGKIIQNVILPPLNIEEHKVITYKIMPRSQNAHAIVNAGFLYKLRNDNIVISARIVYGGLSPSFVRGASTEVNLVGKHLFVNDTLQAAIEVLEAELVLEEKPPAPSAKYRKYLALALFYKSLLSICPTSNINPRFRSATTKLHQSRPVSDAHQIYDTKPSLYPLGQPIPKIEALIQCSGEASYTDDRPAYSLGVHAAFVLSTIPKGKIESIDPTLALQQPGVIAFYSAKDIPGLNSFTPFEAPTDVANEEVLSSGQINYFSQPIGIIVAETQHKANKASKLVVVKYSDVTKPVLSVKEAKKDPKRVHFFKEINATDKGNDINKVIKGSNTIYGQSHFTMETIVCITHPTEEGLQIHSTTQFMDAVQLMISRALNIDQNRIDVQVRRIGGGFGLKISRNTQVAVACSLVAYKLNKPCHFIMPLTGITKAFGKRFPCSADYEVGVNTRGQIQYLNINMYEDNGFMINEQLSVYAVDNFNNCYDKSNWNYKSFNVTTDTAKNTWFRSPGTFENTAMIETVMEHISYTLSMDPIEVRNANFDDMNICEMVNTLLTTAQYSERKQSMEKFNKDNRWKKRGLRISLLRFTPKEPRYYDVNLAVYHGDGSVVITHGGVEMGQGINTKVIQVCAFLLQIPIDKIKVKATNTTTAPNSQVSGGSVTTQYICVAVQRCCKELLNKLKYVKNLTKNLTWEELIKKAYEMNVDLQTHGFVGAESLKIYNIYGATLSEVEIDVLTGEIEILRVDILEDVGQSVSPKIDVGQVEGAFVMGLGYWTSEKLVYDTDTGELLTDRTWNYYVPLARDIPQDFRVYFRKNSYNNDLFFGAKAVSEPPICMAISIPFAIREGISSARLESGIPSENWFEIEGPYTLEKICMSSATKLSDFKYM